MTNATRTRRSRFARPHAPRTAGATAAGPLGTASEVFVPAVPSRYLRLGAAVLALLVAGAAAFRIASTYHVFSNTYDEPLHIAAGMEFLARGAIAYDDGHPPLPRMVAALGPYVLGARSSGLANQFLEGDAVLNSGPGYRRNLDAARAAMLPFFLLACLVLFLWTRSVAGDVAAAASMLAFALTPTILGHAGLATTDMAGAAGLTACAYALARWIDSPTSWVRTVVLGAAAALAVATKLSSLPFLCIAAGLMVLARVRGGSASGRVVAGRGHLRRILPRLVTAAAVAGVLLFATYGFEIGRIRGVPVPMPGLIRSIRFLIGDHEAGHVAFLGGESYVGGKAAFFPVVLAVKTPLPLLLLSAAGLLVTIATWWRTRRAAWIDPLILGAAVLVVAMASNLNLGVRHVLALYPVLAMWTGVAVASVARPTQGRWPSWPGRAAVAGLFAWLSWGTWRAYPDYMAYFNELAGAEPGAIVVDSDLDWGQDIDRLADTVKSRGITSLSLGYYGTSDHPDSVLPGLRRLGRAAPSPRTTGWLAVSETLYRRGTSRLDDGAWTLYPDAYAWLRGTAPVARVGRSIRLYYIPADRSAADSGATGVTR